MLEKERFNPWHERVELVARQLQDTGGGGVSIPEGILCSLILGTGLACAEATETRYKRGGVSIHTHTHIYIYIYIYIYNT